MALMAGPVTMRTSVCRGGQRRARRLVFSAMRLGPGRLGIAEPALGTEAGTERAARAANSDPRSKVRLAPSLGGQGSERLDQLVHDRLGLPVVVAGQDDGAIAPLHQRGDLGQAMLL